MRIALVVERFEPGAGGVESVAWTSAHALAEAGDEVAVVARLAQASPSVCLRLVDVPSFWQPLRALAFSRAAALAAPRAAFDAVISYGRTRHQDIYRAGGGNQLDYLEHVHSNAGLQRWFPRHAALVVLERGVFRDATQLVLCNSNRVCDEIRARYAVPGERLAVIHNGVDHERFRPRDARERAGLRAELGVGTAPMWLFVGTGFWRKGLDTALRALAASHSKDAGLWVAGADSPAPWRRLARKLGVASRIRFLGFRRDPHRLCAAADALILPTRYDAFANACLEAAAAGLPVITSAVSGSAELLGETCIVIEDANDASAFARALDSLSDPGVRAALGEAARSVAVSHGWDVHVTALRALLTRARSQEPAPSW